MPLQHIDPANYEAQLASKVSEFKTAFAPFGLPEPAIHRSALLNYRMRAEFRMFHLNGRVDYAMFAAHSPKRPVVIQDYPLGSKTLVDLMPRLLERLQASDVLRNALYQTEFLTTLSGQAMVTLVYRRPLSEAWEAEARQLTGDLGIQIVGRSRGRKHVLERDWLLESFELNGRTLHYQQVEASFTQPNGEVNRQMLAWACAQAAGLGGDLLELYCGNGNFTIALAPLFKRVLATEVSKSSVKAAEYNLAANQVDNVAVVRLSSEELSAAMAGTETFTRLQHIDLKDYHFSTIFVDPPRAGLDDGTLALAAGFENILYISCNPQTLLENVTALNSTHEIAASAVFDQFPYTHHLEAGLLLRKRQPAA